MVGVRRTDPGCEEVFSVDDYHSRLRSQWGPARTCDHVAAPAILSGPGLPEIIGRAPWQTTSSRALPSTTPRRSRRPKVRVWESRPVR